MFDFLPFKRKTNEAELLDIESVLQSSLKPVSPRPEFIHNLQRGLMEFTFPDYTDLDSKRTIIFALVGLASLVFIFSLWIRLIVVVVGSLGMLQFSKRKKGQQQAD